MSMTFFRELKKNLPRLHLKNCSFAVTQPWVCEYGQYFGEGQSRFQGLTAFWYNLGRGEKNLYARLSL